MHGQTFIVRASPNTVGPFFLLAQGALRPPARGRRPPTRPRRDRGLRRVRAEPGWCERPARHCAYYVLIALAAHTILRVRAGAPPLSRHAASLVIIVPHSPRAASSLSRILLYRSRCRARHRAPVGKLRSHSRNIGAQQHGHYM
jgi:hypothetical protein